MPARNRRQRANNQDVDYRTVGGMARPAVRKKCRLRRMLTVGNAPPAFEPRDARHPYADSRSKNRPATLVLGGRWPVEEVDGMA
jgi:hypothetical protein